MSPGLPNLRDLEQENLVFYKTIDLHIKKYLRENCVNNKLSRKEKYLYDRLEKIIDILHDLA